MRHKISVIQMLFLSLLFDLYFCKRNDRNCLKQKDQPKRDFWYKYFNCIRPGKD